MYQIRGLLLTKVCFCFKRLMSKCMYFFKILGKIANITAILSLSFKMIQSLCAPFGKKNKTYETVINWIKALQKSFHAHPYWKHVTLVTASSDHAIFPKHKHADRLIKARWILKGMIRSPTRTLAAKDTQRWQNKWKRRGCYSSVYLLYIVWQ